MQMLSDGFILKREDRSQKDIYIQLIDYKGLQKQRNPNTDNAISIVAEGKGFCGRRFYKLKIADRYKDDYEKAKVEGWN